MGAIRSRAVVDQLMAALTNVRKAESTVPFELDYGFGNLAFDAHGRPTRLTWIHKGGIVLKKVAAPPVQSEETDSEGEPVTTVPAQGYRRADYLCRIWANGFNRDDAAINAERILDQLATAALQLEFPDQVSFLDAPYKFTSEVDGKHIDKGALLDATVYIQSSVPSQPVGGTMDVVVTGYEFKDGIVDDVETSVDDVPDGQFEIDRVEPEPDTWEDYWEG